MEIIKRHQKEILEIKNYGMKDDVFTGFTPQETGIAKEKVYVPLT